MLPCARDGRYRVQKADPFERDEDLEAIRERKLLQDSYLPDSLIDYEEEHETDATLEEAIAHFEGDFGL